MDLGAFRSTLKARLAAIDPRLTAYDVVPAKPEVPAAVIEIGTIVVHSSMDKGDCDVPFTITILVQLSDWESAQNQMDAYCSIGLGGKCVVDAVEDSQVTIESITPPGSASIGNDTYGSVVFHGTAMFG